MSAAHPIPLTTLDRPICFVGATGSGKTTAAKGAVEQLLDAGRRVIVIDPTGVWWGLRLSSDGALGYPIVIFGGEHADVPIGAGAGERLGRLLAAGDVRAAIVDTSEFSTGETIALLTPFFEALYAGLRGALHLVVDEADAMAPQNPMPDGRRLLGVVDKIARRGRVKGFRPLWITQRPAVLNKNVLSQVSTLVAMQLRSPQDRKALDSWIQGNADAEAARDVVRQLPGLPVGSGFVWAPGDDRLECVAFPPAGTFDSSRAPEPGDAEAAVAPLGAVDVEALRTALAPETAPPKPEGGMAAKPRRAGKNARSDDAVEHVRRQDRAAEYADGYAQGWRDALNGALGVVDGGAIELRRRLAEIPPSPTPAEAAPVQPRPSAPARAPNRRRTPADDADLNSAARKMRDVLDTNPPVRRSWSTVARLAGLKARGGHFTSGKKQLLTAGVAIDRGGLAEIAVPSAGAVPFSVDVAALVETWAEVLGGLAGRILAVLGAGGFTTREALAESLCVAPRGGHWSAAWKALRDNDLVNETDGKVRLSTLFRGE